ncbi:MAG: C25 family cysteine peptidase [bacterium]|nr:C25 family cysteine peptidase [bacterium]
MWTLRRFRETDAAPSGSPSLGWLQGRLHCEEEDQSMARANDLQKGMDYSFWDTVDTNNSVTEEYQLFDQDSGGGDARLALRFKAYQLDRIATLRVYAGTEAGTPQDAVITVQVSDTGRLYEVWGVIPSSELVDGTNYLTFELTVPGSNSPGASSYAGLYTDSFQVIYSRGPRMQSGSLEGWGPPDVSGDRVMRVTDVTGDSLAIWDLTRGESLVNFDLTGPEGSRDASFTWNAEPDYHLAVADLSRAFPPLDVYLDAPSDLHSPVDADLVYIVHPDLVASLDPLVEMHRSRGFRVQVVRVDDIYDEYSGGRLDPTAIRDYLYHAWTDCVGDPLTFVTLVGDTSGDYRDVEHRYLGPNWRKFPQAMLPTAYVITYTPEHYFVACDGYFASLLPEEQPDSDVPLPQVALTRISAYEPSQLDTYVALACVYPELPGGSWQTNHVLLADNTVNYDGDPPPGSQNEPITFDIYAENMLRTSTPAGMYTDKVYMTALGMARTRDNYYTPQKYDVGKRRWATREHVTPAFLDAIRQGELVVSFIGHGAWHTWAHELAETNRPPLYRDFDQWECPVPPLLIQSSCSVADFDRTLSMDRNCVSELLLWHPLGCIATTGSTRLSGGASQDLYHRLLFEAFYHPDQHLETPAFGLAHMQDLILGNDPLNSQRQTMFGDSASVLRRAVPGLDIDPPSGTVVARGAVIVVTGVQTLESPDNPRELTGTVQIRAYDRPLMPYTYNETRIYRLVGTASTELVDGSFRTQIALPLDMNDDLSDYEIYPYTLELRAYMVDETTGETITDCPFSGDEVWSLPIVGSVDPPADNEGPQVNLFFDDGATASGDYIDGSVKLTAELSDPQGILLIRSDGGVPMASGDIDRPIILVAEAENHSFDIDLTDAYKPVPGDYTRGVVERQLELPAGDYTLTLYCYDNFGEPGSASAELVVADRLGLSEVLVVPNPAPGPTAFTFFASTRPDQACVRIYTPVGRLVRTLEATDLVTGFNVIEWDGNDNGGRPLANGVYLYSLEARDGDDTTTAFEKFIMLR